METRDIQELSKKIRSMQVDYTTSSNELYAQISEKEQTIIKLQDEVAKLKKQKREAEENQWKVLGSYQDALERKIQSINKAYGRYNISILGPIVATMASSVTGEVYTFEIVGGNPASASVNGYRGVYSREIAIIKKENDQTAFSFAASERPDDSAFYDGWGRFINCEDYLPAAPKSMFNPLIGDIVAKFDVDEDTFVWGDLSEDDEPFDFIKDFIAYVSNYRLQNDIKTMTKEQLEQLAATFLEEHKEDYQESRPKVQPEPPKPLTMQPVQNNKKGLLSSLFKRNS